MYMFEKKKQNYVENQIDIFSFFRIGNFEEAVPIVKHIDLIFYIISLFFSYH